MTMTRCSGCGGLFPDVAGPTHPYMLSSPGCWARYGEVLAREYSDPALLPTHRLSVDAYAVQHPGSPDDPRAVKSVGLHLARLMVQLDSAMPPDETNDVMLGLSAAKASLPLLVPPASFASTVADMPTDAPVAEHIAAVRHWAAATWADWSNEHAAIRIWTEAARATR